MNISPKQIVRASTSVKESCPFCEEGRGKEEGLDYLVKRTNHLISAHGFEVLHIGQESETGLDGELYQTTVAILGSETEVPELDRSQERSELNAILSQGPTAIER